MAIKTISVNKDYPKLPQTYIEVVYNNEVIQSQENSQYGEYIANVPYKYLEDMKKEYNFEGDLEEKWHDNIQLFLDTFYIPRPSNYHENAMVLNSCGILPEDMTNEMWNYNFEMQYEKWMIDPQTAGYSRIEKPKNNSNI